MNTYRNSILIGVIFLCGLSGCEDIGTPGMGDFAIYRLRDPAITSYQANAMPLGSLELALTPFISSKDIRAYYWETHAIAFTPEMDSTLDNFARHEGTTSGRPFVVTVGGDRIYLGTFWWAYSSSLPNCPFIETLGLLPRRISLPSLPPVDDPRADVRIYQSLQKAGILASGVSM